MDNTITIKYFINPDGMYIGYIKEHPGVMSQGYTLSNLMVNLSDALNTMEYFKNKDRIKV